ncbi:MAG: cupin domain-containing protein [Alcanivorax sp.]|nr:cupin domain-containing protein [Alcanivorax sp.]
MILHRNGSRASMAGPQEIFTGRVRIDPIHLQAEEPSRLTSALVTFEPGARTNWHTHPLGQLLIVTAGRGWTQCDGGERVEVNAGDTIWCPPGHKHWHGATSDTAMSHIAVQEMLDGRNVDWLEPVTDEQYLNSAGQ